MRSRERQPGSQGAPAAARMTGHPVRLARNSGRDAGELRGGGWRRPRHLTELDRGRVGRRLADSRLAAPARSAADPDRRIRGCLSRGSVRRGIRRERAAAAGSPAVLIALVLIALVLIAGIVRPGSLRQGGRPPSRVLQSPPQATAGRSRTPAGRGSRRCPCGVVPEPEASAPLPSGPAR